MNNSSTICVDANMVIRFVVVPGDKAVQECWNRWEAARTALVAPSLLYYEVTNGFHRYRKQGTLSPRALKSALETAFGLGINLLGDADLHRRATQIAQTFNLPATYDAHYVALSERLGIELWTTDARLVNALQPFKVDWVKLAGA
jgi:predicted nucleic acid-binding protein